jgi:hypothetical protein
VQLLRVVDQVFMVSNTPLKPLQIMISLISGMHVGLNLALM